jgi:hypothetical protein
MMNYRNLFDSGNLASISKSAAMLGIMGAVLGGTIAVIENTYKVAKGEKKSAEAVANIAKETVGSGISVATAAATMAALGIGGLIGLAGFAAVATISKGLLDSILYGEKSGSESSTAAKG